MIDGARSWMAMIYGMKDESFWQPERHSNMLDGAAHYYRCYQCSDQKWMAVGAIEDRFYVTLLKLIGIDDEDLSDKNDPENWAILSEKLTSIFLTKTRSEWQGLFEGTEACCTPVLDMDEAPNHPHNIARNTFVNVDGNWQPSPAPRFSRSSPDPSYVEAENGAHSTDIMLELGYSKDEIADLRISGTID